MMVMSGPKKLDATARRHYLCISVENERTHELTPRNEPETPSAYLWGTMDAEQEILVINMRTSNYVQRT